MVNWKRKVGEEGLHDPSIGVGTERKGEPQKVVYYKIMDETEFPELEN